MDGKSRRGSTGTLLRKGNQCGTILSILMSRGYITAWEAKKIGIMNLSSRISEMRELGLGIAIKDHKYRLTGKRKKCRPIVLPDGDLFPNFESE